MRKLLFLFVAIFTTTTLFGQSFSLISVSDGTAADWDALPAEYVASATHTEGCSYDGLKSVKVYCDDNYLNILLEVNLDVVTDREWTPFHIFLNADGSAETGGSADEFADADAEWMLETAIYASGYVNSYNPAVFKWWGEVGGYGWLWTDPEVEPTSENCWGAIVCEGSYLVGTSQMVDGDLGKVEIQLLKEFIPAQWANEFTIGFDIQQKWATCGILPNAADDEIGNAVRAEKLRVLTHAVLPQDGLHYKVTSHVEPYTMAVVGADADITTATIPETIEVNGKTFAVTSIGGEAFLDCFSLTSITIPNSVTSIGYNAFRGCSSLTSITIPNSITEINSGIFAGCSSLTSITIPNSITSIGHGAFAGCSSLTSISIPNSITSIGGDAFQGCSSLTSIAIPNSITSIGGDAFQGCSSLTSITIPNSITEINSGIFAGCSSLTSITIPNSVTSIGYGAFSYCSSLTSITIPNSVTSIGDNAFSNCSSLEYLSIPNSVKFSEEYVYDEDDYTWTEYYDGFSCIVECYNLKTLIVPADFFGVDLEDYYESDFMEELAYLPRQLESLTINGGNMTHPFGWDFMVQNRKSLKNIDFGATESIAAEAFTNFYNLESLVLPSHLETVPYMAVAECVKLKSISIPATVVEIEDRAFENCRMLSSVAFAENGALTRIGNWAFYNNHELTNLVIPEGVTEVGHAAFYGCTYLAEMTLPSTVQEIADNGFALCGKLKKMHVKATTPPTIYSKTFEGVDRAMPVYVPDESVDAYKEALYWKELNIQALTPVDNIPTNKDFAHKFLYNGQLLIIRDGKTYTIMGAEIH